MDRFHLGAVCLSAYETALCAEKVIYDVLHDFYSKKIELCLR